MCALTPVLDRDVWPFTKRRTATETLAFLKRNCTREGGTYWLYKTAGDDVVKLYV